MGKATDLPPIFCKQCGYCLYGLPENRCPECGRAFDPADPATFFRRPRRVWRKGPLIRIGILFLLLAMAYFVPIGWLYWGYRSETPARALAAGPNDVAHTEAIWPDAVLELMPASWRIWAQRVDKVELQRPYAGQPPADWAESLARCRRLRTLHLDTVQVQTHDIQVISRVGTLVELEIYGSGSGSADLSALASLSSLERLRLDHSSGLNDRTLAAIAHLPKLRSLDLCGPTITDAGLAALATMPNLKGLSLSQCSSLTDAAVDQLTPLKGLTSLSIWNVLFSQQARSRLRAAIPHCAVDYAWTR